jgi:hypothetical protein
VQLLQEIHVSKPNVKVIYKSVILPNKVREVNMMDICADRAKFLAMKPKKKTAKRNMG